MHWNELLHWGCGFNKSALWKSLLWPHITYSFDRKVTVMPAKRANMKFQSFLLLFLARPTAGKTAVVASHIHILNFTDKRKLLRYFSHDKIKNVLKIALMEHAVSLLFIHTKLPLMWSSSSPSSLNVLHSIDTRTATMTPTTTKKWHFLFDSAQTQNKVRMLWSKIRQNDLNKNEL